MNNAADAVHGAVEVVQRIDVERAYAEKRAHSLFRAQSDRLAFTASCVLVALGSDVALITAAHALKREVGLDFALGAGTQLSPLVGSGRWGTLDDGRAGKGEDPLDIRSCSSTAPSRPISIPSCSFTLLIRCSRGARSRRAILGQRATPRASSAFAGPMHLSTPRLIRFSLPLMSPPAGRPPATPPTCTSCCTLIGSRYYETDFQ